MLKCRVEGQGSVRCPTKKQHSRAVKWYLQCFHRKPCGPMLIVVLHKYIYAYIHNARTCIEAYIVFGPSSAKAKRKCIWHDIYVFSYVCLHLFLVTQMYSSATFIKDVPVRLLGFRYWSLQPFWEPLIQTTTSHTTLTAEDYQNANIKPEISWRLVRYN